MDSRHVTADQARAIARWVDPTVRRLMRLQQRMEARGFPPADTLYVRVAAARKTLAELNGALSGYNDPCRRPLPGDDEPPRM